MVSNSAYEIINYIHFNTLLTFISITYHHTINPSSSYNRIQTTNNYVELYGEKIAPQHNRLELLTNSLTLIKIRPKVLNLVEVSTQELRNSH